MTVTPPPAPWPAPSLADLVVADTVADAGRTDAAKRAHPVARRQVAALLSTAKRYSSRSERAEHAAAKEEQRMAAELDDLPAGWFVLHAVDIGVDARPDTRRVDHIAIGPGGVFTIYVEHQNGAKVWISEHALTINGRDSDQVRRARSEARQATGRLTDACGFDVTVQSVLVLVGAATMQMLSHPPEVHVRDQHDIRDWLCRQPARLDAERVRGVYDELRPAERPAESPPAGLLDQLVE